jgi:hypothetical protein
MSLQSFSGCDPVNRGFDVPSAAYQCSQWPLGKKVPEQVAGRDPLRRSITIINDPDGTTTVYLVDGANRLQASGIKLKPGAGVTLNTAAPVYVLNPTGDGTVVYVNAETGVA